jgi:16S rRNA G966 N2-methylase RsmD
MCISVYKYTFVIPNLEDRKKYKFVVNIQSYTELWYQRSHSYYLSLTRGKLPMPHLNSLHGLNILFKYVRNWYLLLALYTNVIKKAKVQFRDGFEVEISNRNQNKVNQLSDGFGFKGSVTWLQNSTNFDIFYEELYKRYLEDNGFRYQTNQENTIVNTPGGLRIIMKPPYSFVLDEIFIMKVYGEPKLSGRVAIDVGASIGDSSLYFSSLGAAKVYGFEVDSHRFETALRNAELNNLSEKITLFNHGATADSIQDIILGNNFNDVFLKMDCEGCEYEVLLGLSREVFQRVTEIVLEYHKSPKPLLGKLQDLNYRISTEKSIIYAMR